jgi:hypothetical protein
MSMLWHRMMLLLLLLLLLWKRRWLRLLLLLRAIRPCAAPHAAHVPTATRAKMHDLLRMMCCL